jgi:hypothetical protein
MLALPIFGNIQRFPHLTFPSATTLIFPANLLTAGVSSTSGPNKSCKLLKSLSARPLKPKKDLSNVSNSPLAGKHVYLEKEDFDFVSVGGYLHEHHSLDKIGGMEYMYRLSDLMPSVSNLGPYIELIREAKLKRDIIYFAEDIMQTGYSGEKDVNNFVDYAEQGIFEISKRRRTSGFV